MVHYQLAREVTGTISLVFAWSVNGLMLYHLNPLLLEVAASILEIFSRTVLYLQLLSDRGAQFVDKVVSQLSKLLEITKLCTTDYNTQTNGGCGAHARDIGNYAVNSLLGRT